MIHVPEKSAEDELSRRVLGNCAAEMGWSDQDNDGILDLDDPLVPSVTPEGFRGIEIRDRRIETGVRQLLFANMQMTSTTDSIVLRGTVVERGTNRPIATNVVFTETARNPDAHETQSHTGECLTEGARFACVINGVDTTIEHVSIQAHVGTFSTEWMYR